MPGQSVDEREAAATEGSADQLAEDTMDVSDADRPTKTRDRRGASAGMHLDEATPDHAPSERSGSGSTASTSKRENKSAFVKITKLGEEEMLMAYMEAFFGKSYGTQHCLPTPWIADGSRFGE